MDQVRGYHLAENSKKLEFVFLQQIQIFWIHDLALDVAQIEDCGDERASLEEDRIWY